VLERLDVPPDSSFATVTTFAADLGHTSVFGALASEDQNVSRFVAKLPGALGQTKTTLGKVDVLAQELGPTLDSLRPAVRQLDPANHAVLPLAKEGTPIVRDQIRPFARVAQPFTRDLGKGARGLSKAAPNLSKSFLELNRFFNMGAYNPGGREGLSGDLMKDRARQEGYLYWLGWVATVTNSLFNTADANGPYRRFTLGGLSCSILKAQAQPEIPAPLLSQLGGIDTVIEKLGQAGACVK